MHELSSVNEAIGRILNITPLPKKIKIRIGEMRGNPKTFEEMLREHSSGTGIESIDITIETIPTDISCACGFSGRVPVLEHVHFVRCPKCGNIADILKGNELEIEVVK